MRALTTIEVLTQEAEAIHGADLSGISGTEFYQKLYELNSVALCLSGGGMRSASFALGIIEALAMNPRRPELGHADSSDGSFLAKFNYLSTVSGGGYIGTWLSAGVARAGFAALWSDLVRRPEGPDVEPPMIGWLRSYSNFLTPKLGLTSADTWAALVLILRNLVLNWLVILPVLVFGLVLVKLYAFAVIWPTEFHELRLCRPWMGVAAFLGAVSVIIALYFMHTERPTHFYRKAGQGVVLLKTLLPASLSGIFFSFPLAGPCTGDLLYYMPWFSWGGGPSIVLLGLLFGCAIYFIAWVGALPWRNTWRSVRLAISRRERWRAVAAALPEHRAWNYLFIDVIAVLVAGALYGVLMALGIYLYIRTWDEILLVLLAVPWSLFSLMLADVIFVGISSHELRSDADLEWLARAFGWCLAMGLVWLITMFLVFFAISLAPRVADLYRETWAWMTGAGAGAVAAWFGKHARTPAKGGAKNPTEVSFNAVATIAAMLFASMLIVLTSEVLDRVFLQDTLISSRYFRGNAGSEVGYPPWPAGWLWLGLTISIVVGAAASYYVNINRFSLHSFYRNRLIRAFLGASHAATRRPNPFTDFDEKDDLFIHQLWPRREIWEETRGRGWQPFHIINMALNVVSSKRLAWQERKAESFTASPLHTGTACSGQRIAPGGAFCAQGAFQLSTEYGGHDGISLGTAVAISGAAASPNMGYHSSPPLAFLMTMFNARLGWWLGNPGKSDRKIYGSAGPRFAIGPLFAEMFGLTSDTSNYVYLSDGGHFENLGLYEMVRRRCRFVLVSDAGWDPDFAFEDLGNAVRKIALDFGVTITFYGITALKNRAEEDRLGRHRNDHAQERRIDEQRPTVDDDVPLCALGTIEYGAGQAGIVLYVKAAYHRTIVRNVGVRSYAIANPDFPHQSTGDQFFSESQFESYRALGFELMEGILTRGAALVDNPGQPTLLEIFGALHDKAVRDGLR